MNEIQLPTSESVIYTTIMVSAIVITLSGVLLLDSNKIDDIRDFYRNWIGSKLISGILAFLTFIIGSFVIPISMVAYASNRNHTLVDKAISEHRYVQIEALDVNGKIEKVWIDPVFRVPEENIVGVETVK